MFFLLGAAFLSYVYDEFELKDCEIKKMCNMERDTIELALKYYCELKDWEQINHKKIQI